MWTKPVISELPDWTEYTLIAFDTETHDPSIGAKLGCGAERDGEMVGYSFAMVESNGTYSGYYVPLRQAGGGNVDVAEGLAYLRDQFSRYEGDITGANLPYDLRYLAAEGIDFSKVGLFRDVQIAAPLLDETLEGGYSLNNIALTMGFPGKDESVLIEAAEARGLDPKADLWQLPAEMVAEYAIKDALLPLELIVKQEAEIERQSMTEVYELECKLLPVLVKMTIRGIRVDLDHLAYLEELYPKRMEDAVEEFNRLTGQSLKSSELNLSKMLGEALDKLGVEYPTTPKSGDPSVTSALLLASKRDDLAQLNAAREAKNAISKVKSIRKHLTPDGRIHASFNQLRKSSDGNGNVVQGTVSGRLSSANPNIQQQPRADEWRKLYLPEEGDHLLSVDYSAQELRMAVHFSHAFKDNSAKRLVEAYQKDPRVDIYKKMAQSAGVERSVAKIVVLGVMYGMGSGKMAESLGLPVDPEVRWRTGDEGKPFPYHVAGVEGMALINTFKHRYPWMDHLKTRAERVVSKRSAHGEKGYVNSIRGRRCRFPQKNHGAYKALNRLIQSSGADQMKQALVDLDAAGFTLLASIHDEVLVSLSDRNQANEVARLMVEAIPLLVPTVVDKKIGPSWGTMEKI